jgi:phospholipase C
MGISWLRPLLTRRTTRATRPARGRRSPARPATLLEVLQLEDRLVLSSNPINNIDHFVVIYQENWSFDSLYGKFPGANGISSASQTALTQVDKSGKPLTSLPAVKGPDGKVDPRFPANLPVGPYDTLPYLTKNAPPGDPAGLTGDMIHRFYTEPQQIDGGKMDKFVSWSDNGGLVMGYVDATNLPEGQLAQQYTLDDNFFHAAYGGSFLNSQFFVAAAAPQWNQPLPTSSSSFVSTLDANGAPINDGNLTANNLLSPNGNHFVVNTTQPAQAPFRPGTPADQRLKPINDNHPLLSNGQPDPTYTPTIGDRLNDAGVSWKWYSGGWSDALAGNPATDPNGFGGGFQFHHQALAYYANFAPFNADGSPNPKTNSLLNPNAHLQDETQFFDDLASGKLPAVSFVKPVGANNEHPGYANLLQGQQHVADIVHAIQNSPAWAHTAVIITYDENGGFWDHVSPPKLGDGTWGDGSRVPAIVISPYAKQGYVDHTQHDTLSILKTIEERYNLKPLNNLDAKASDLSSDFQKTAATSVGQIYLQRDANSPGKFTLVVVGTQGDDRIDITKEGTDLHVRARGKGWKADKFFAAGDISRIEVYGQGGDDRITVADDVTQPAMLFGGAGDDHLKAGGGPSVLVGGPGDDHLVGGLKPSILIGGKGSDDLKARAGAAVLIGGTTRFDANLQALTAILKEWARTDLTYDQRVADLKSGGKDAQNGSYLLNATTVHDDDARDYLRGGEGMDLFFAHLTGKGKKDKLFGVKAGEDIVAV